MLLVQNTRNMDKEILVTMIWVVCMFFIGVLIGKVGSDINHRRNCKHKNKVLRVIYSCVNCETTAIFCQDCAKQLTEAKIDCR